MRTDVRGRNMRDSRTHQPLSYAVRLPDEAQADTLRLLDASRALTKARLAGGYLVKSVTTMRIGIIAPRLTSPVWAWYTSSK